MTADLTAGLSAAESARRRGLPRAVVDLAVARAQAEGRLRLVDLGVSLSCDGPTCTPDPDSPVCAGCPLMPLMPLRSGRRRPSDGT